MTHDELIGALKGLTPGLIEASNIAFNRKQGAQGHLTAEQDFARIDERLDPLRKLLQRVGSDGATATPTPISTERLEEKRAGIEDMRAKWRDNPAMPAYQRLLFDEICDLALLSLRQQAQPTREEVLEEALKPFAMLGEQLERDYPDYADHIRVFFDLTHRDFRRAIRALKSDAPAREAGGLFGTFIERDDGSTEFRRTGEPHTPTAQGYRSWNLYASASPAEPAAHSLQTEWAMVPREPTEAMIEAGRDAYWRPTQFVADATMADAYRAMLAASPSPPSVSEPVVDRRNGHHFEYDE